MQFSPSSPVIHCKSVVERKIEKVADVELGDLHLWLLWLEFSFILQA